MRMTYSLNMDRFQIAQAGLKHDRQLRKALIELLNLPLYFVRTVITPGSQQFLELFKKKF